MSKRVVTLSKERLMTAAGIASGIDMALTLASLVADEERAQCIQLALEYNPEPPFAAGSPSTAPKAIYDKMVIELQAQL